MQKSRIINISNQDMEGLILKRKRLKKQCYVYKASNIGSSLWNYSLPYKVEKFISHVEMIDTS